MINLDLKTIGFYILIALIPVLIWLWFWLKEDNDHPEPKGLLFFTFVLGMLAVVFVLPFEKWAKGLITDNTFLIVTWAATEEIMKYLAVALIALQTSFIDEPIDYPIYFIVAALGFATLENILFLNQAGGLDNATVSLLTGNLRFFGATLLHSISSGIIGVMMGLAFHRGRLGKTLYFVGGLAGAVALHSVFNFFIMRNNGQDFLKIFALLWVFSIIFILILEKLRRLSHGDNYQLAAKS
jgi:RsiW-degrading membrane proteinase PrsW (M82 family)